MSHAPVRALRVAFLMAAALMAAALAGAALAPALAQNVDRRALVAACRADVKRLCPGVRPGGGAIAACLREKAAELSSGCGQALRDAAGAQKSAPDKTSELPAGARVLRDVAYGADPKQRFDVYLPRAPKRAPILVMVHGGAWANGDKANAPVVENKVAHWSPRGYVFVSVNTRLQPEAEPLEQARDVAKALAAVQSQAASWGADSRKIVLMGHSAGAHLVALLAADPTIARAAGARPWLGTVGLDSAAYDVPAIMTAPHFALYDRAFGADPAYWRRVSPQRRLSRGPEPMLLVCSTRRSDSCAQARAFADAVRDRHGRATTLPVALSHRQINASLGLDSDYTAMVDAFIRSLGLS